MAPYDRVCGGALCLIASLASLSAAAVPARHEALQCTSPERLMQITEDRKFDQELSQLTQSEAAAFVDNLLRLAGQAQDEATREAWFRALTAFLGRFHGGLKGPTWRYPWAAVEYGGILGFLTSDWKTTTPALQSCTLQLLLKCDRDDFRSLPTADETTRHVAELLFSKDTSLRIGAVRTLGHLWREMALPGEELDLWRSPTGGFPSPDVESRRLVSDVVAQHPDWCPQLARIDTETGGCPPALWLLAMGPRAEAFDVLEAKFRACSLSARLCQLMWALRFADPGR